MPDDPSAGPKLPPFIESREGVVYLRVRVKPRGKRAAIEGVHGASLKVTITAPPVEGEANRCLVDFLARLLGVRKSRISIDSGLKSREKRVRIEGMRAEEVARALS
ncbi:MAG: DUF167 domain-containing protein [Thermodesulfobacteriota bacterium]